MSQPFDIKKLASTLRTLRRKKRLSLNRLAKLTGISRRTLGRIEDATRGSRPVRPRGLGAQGRPATSEKRQKADPSTALGMTRRKGRGTGISARTAFKLAKALLGEEETERRMDDATRLSRFLGDDPLYKYLDVLYDYPAFLFHDSPEQQALRAEFGDDYRHSLDLLLRSGFGTRNLGARLRAFRMQHDLTLIETADLLGLSKSELHRLERAERRPSPRTRYRILRLLTLPISRVAGRGARVAALKALLAQPPPKPDARSSRHDALESLRHLWLAGSLKTCELAAALGVSPPHLIRLLRGDRRPSRALTDRIQHLLP